MQYTTPTFEEEKEQKGGKSSALKRYYTELVKIGDTFEQNQLQQVYNAMQMNSVMPFLECLDLLNQNGYLIRKKENKWKLT